MTGGRVNINARLAPAPSLYPWHRALTECAGDDCQCKHGDPVHPPLLMTFDPDLGKYLEASKRCSALWAVAGPGRDRGRHCAEEATHQVGDVLLCEHHYRRMRDWMNTRDQRDQLAEVRTAQIRFEEEVRLARKLAEQQRELDRETARQRIALAKEEAKERVRAEEAARAEVSLVYYVRRESDGMIKIGTSRTLPARMATLQREHGPLKLIATEGGNHKEETALHRRFVGHRAQGEWFRPELPLLEHVYALMRERPLEAAPGLPPIMNSREVGGMILRLKAAGDGLGFARVGLGWRGRDVDRPHQGNFHDPMGLCAITTTATMMRMATAKRHQSRRVISSFLAALAACGCTRGR